MNLPLNTYVLRTTSFVLFCRVNDFKTVHSSSRLRELSHHHHRPGATGALDTTTFFIPGLDTRVHYISKTEDSPVLSNPSLDASAASLSAKRGSGKKATLTAWMTLQSIQEETIITPTILEFLEQALAPIPTFSVVKGGVAAGEEEEEGGGAASPAASDDDDDPDSNSDSQTGLPAPLVYASSFPVDVIVYFNMQSSTFRFSCLPVSRVECMLRLPSLDLVFSSKRADGEIHQEFGRSEGGGGAGGVGLKQQRSGVGSGSAATDDGDVIGGLSITGCLSDFSLYMFHPYGGGRKQKPEDMNFSPLTSEERRDSLSVNVAFVKFHISRSRKLNFNKISLESSQRAARLSHADKKSMACVRFSTIVDIGSASFKYDIRRLTEILTFPKAWYRRTLVRRLFLGELKTTSFHPESRQQQQQPPGTPVVTGGGGADGAKGREDGRRKSVAQQQGLNPGGAGGKVAADAAKQQKQQQQDQRKIWIGQTTAHSWETLVMTTVKFKELKVHVNMGNVMGNVEWVSKDFRAGARLSISSTGHKNMFLSLGLNGSNFEAKSGIVGGAFNLGRIETFCQLREDSEIEPFHKLGVQLDVIEVRVDYMSTSVLMGRISHFNTAINDDWHVTGGGGGSVGQQRSSPAQIFVQGDLSWDQLQVLISKSTTADLLKIGNKLEEFFSQQFKSSKKLFSSLEPRNSSQPPPSLYVMNRKDQQSASASDAASSGKVSHHRHWQRALRKISGMKIYTLPFKLPDVGSVLGGVLELRGRHFSLACFHGINFKSKSWALFSLKDPSISFVSDAQETFEETLEQREEEEGKQEDEDEGKGEGGNGAVASEDSRRKVKRNTTVFQTLSFSLGQADQPTARTHHGYMATVKKISRGVNYLPPIKTLPEWFNYAFRCSELDDVARFPSLSEEKPRQQDSKVQQRTEEIFALPCLRMDLKTEHVQGEGPPTREDPKPAVVCTFVTGRFLAEKYFYYRVLTHITFPQQFSFFSNAKKYFSLYPKTYNCIFSAN